MYLVFLFFHSTGLPEDHFEIPRKNKNRIGQVKYHFKGKGLYFFNFLLCLLLSLSNIFVFLIYGGYTSISHLFCGIFVAAIIETLYVGLTSYWNDPFFGHREYPFSIGKGCCARISHS